MIVTVDPADAQALTSPPPEPPGHRRPPLPPRDLRRHPLPRSVLAPPVAGSPGAPSCPRTGADIDRMAAAGLAATAGSAPLVLWSAKMKSNAAVPAAADPVAPRRVDPEPDS
jgi:hypothetical protein